MPLVLVSRFVSEGNPMRFERISIDNYDPRDTGIQAFYPIEHAAWIWHPQVHTNRKGSALFVLPVEVDEDNLVFTAQISADNRYEFFIDGVRVGMGPDRSDTFHWSFATYKITLERGSHTLEALCHFYPIVVPEINDAIMPLAQLMDNNGGFVFGVCEENLRERFNTGVAPWMARLVAEPANYEFGGWAVGMAFDIDVSAYRTYGEPVTPIVTQMPVPKYNLCGGRNASRTLYPSPLPEQTRNKYESFIRVRAVKDGEEVGANVFISEEETIEGEELLRWQDLINGKLLGGITVPAATIKHVVLDFEDYLCAYPVITANTPAGFSPDAMIHLAWSESLYCDVPGKKIETLEEECNRGDRNAVSGKTFRMEGQRYAFFNFPEEAEEISTMWWKAGRYLLLTVKTGESPLHIGKICFEESRYPLEAESFVTFDDETLQSVQSMMIRALQSCAHETFMDCPYYEQLMYVGDTRLEALTTYALTRDDRLPKRAVTLFDWSRVYWDGLVAEHFPGYYKQLSATFSMIWPLMVRDLMLYRKFKNDAEFKHLRRSVRSMINTIGEYVNEEGLISGLPGWSFVDWVDNSTWKCGIPGYGDSKAATSVFTMHYTMALKAAMELEDYLPEDGGVFNAYYEHCFKRSAEAVRKAFYDESEHLFSDDSDHTVYSVHAQVLALLSDVLPPEEAEKCFESMLARKDILKPTLYFIHYLFDTFQKMGCGEKVLDYVNIWTDMLAKGAVTTWEKPEPTRSECHAWGSHLFYHYFSTVAGIRPVAPGFAKIAIKPAFGHLTKMTGRMAHPDGFIEFDLNKQADGTICGKVVLPEVCVGSLEYNGTLTPLAGGVNEI